MSYTIAKAYRANCKEIMMSEKSQHTSAQLRVQMLSKYGANEHHKHNKWHNRPYRQHWRSHPVTSAHAVVARERPNSGDQPEETIDILGGLHQQKMRVRVLRGDYH